MKCASCGRDSPAGARFCIHCGVEHAQPTPIAVAAAAAAAMRPRGSAPLAANAPRAGVPHDDRVSTATRHQPDAWGGDTQAPAFPAGSDAFDAPAANAGSVSSRPPPPAAAIPVYASHPRRLGTAALLIAACVIVALVAFVAWKMRQAEPESAEAGRAGDSSVMATFPPDATPQRTPAAAEAPASSPLPEPAAAASDATSPPVEIKPLPPAKPTRRPGNSAATASVKNPSPAAPVPAEPAPAPPRPAVVAAAPKAPAVDRWSQMNDELSRCTREDFISRVICDQRVRFRYCNGYWGKVAQCPGNPAPERGQ